MDRALRRVPALGDGRASLARGGLSRADHPPGPHLVDALIEALAPAIDSLGGLVALAFPSDCLLCRMTLETPLEGPLCEPCLEGLPILTGPTCPRCDLPYESSVVPGLCGSCRASAWSFRRARSLYPFDDDVRACIHALKYLGRPRVGRLLGRRAGAKWLEASPAPVAAVVPMPLAPRRRRERGYNQAEVIARAVSSTLGVPLVRRALVRIGDRPPQAGLSAGQRRRNVAGVFRSRRRAAERLRGEPVLLVDDVLTTGATAAAAASCLLATGVEAVDVLTLARVC